MTQLQILFASLTTLLVSTPALAVYSPELGRFRTRDPAGYAGGANLYEYVGSQPMRWLDPMGLHPQLPFNPDAGTSDPRNDPSKGCGISLKRVKKVKDEYRDNVINTEHELIIINDPANDIHGENGKTLQRPEGWGFWPREKDKRNSPGMVIGPGQPQVDNDWDWDTTTNEPYIDDPGTAWKTYVTDSYQTYPPSVDAIPRPMTFHLRMPDGSRPSSKTCEEIRNCVRNEMRKQQNDEWKQISNNCRSAARRALENCGLRVSIPQQ